MCLDRIRTGPAEVAERASAREHVLPFYVSVELLNPSKIFATICADRPRAVTHSMFPAALGEIFNSEVPRCSARLNTVVNIGDGCLVVRKVRL
jgi:hypothetical protein